MAGNFIPLADLGPKVDAEIAELIETGEQEIIDGTFEPFEGPFVDRDGTVPVSEGAKPDIGHPPRSITSSMASSAACLSPDPLERSPSSGDLRRRSVSRLQRRRVLNQLSQHASHLQRDPIGLGVVLDGGVQRNGLAVKALEHRLVFRRDRGLEGDYARPAGLIVGDVVAVVGAVQARRGGVDRLVQKLITNTTSSSK